MQVKHELIKYDNTIKVWAGKYKNSQNLTHWHYDCELLYVERGNLNIMCNKKNYTLTQGQAFFIDSERLHYIKSNSPESVLVTIFFAYELIKPFTRGITLASPKLTSDYDIPCVYAQLKNELQQKNSFYEMSVQLLINNLMLNIFRGEATTPRPKSKPATDNFKQLLELMNKDYEFFNFESAADFMNMSPAYFSKFFHNLSGMTFSRYLNYVKIDKAVNMLSLPEAPPMTQIATQCGFSTIRNFNRIFKELTGYTPTNLPEDYILDESFARAGSLRGNPTLSGCELIESLTVL